MLIWLPLRMFNWTSSCIFLLFAVQGLQVLYTSLNNPSQLTGWKSTGGDPCGESWKGITCQGSSVVSMWVYCLRTFFLNLHVPGGSYPYVFWLMRSIFMNWTDGYLGWDSVEQWDTCSTTLCHFRHCKKAVCPVVEVVLVLFTFFLLNPFHFYVAGSWMTVIFMILFHISCLPTWQACNVNTVFDFI